MKNTNDENWEAQWRKTLAGHKSAPATEDWSGMEHLLKTQIEEPAEAFADPNMPHYPESSIRWFIKFWPQSLLGLLLVTGLGFGLGQCRADAIKDEMEFFSKEADPPPNYHLPQPDTFRKDENGVPISRCAPGPAFRTTTYQAFDENGAPTGKFVTDTLWIDGRDTSGSHGNQPAGTAPRYRLDTVYRLDEMGNLSEEIYSIDTTIIIPRVRGLR